MAYASRFVYKIFLPFFNIPFKIKLIISVVGCIVLLILSMLIGKMFMAVTIHMLVLFFISDILLLVFKIPRLKKYNPQKLKFYKPAYSGLVFILALIISIAGLINASNPVIKKYQVSFDGKSYENTKIMFVSDLHINSSNSKTVFSALNNAFINEKPDIVIVGGDICDSSTDKESFDECVKLLGEFSNSVPVLFVYGNHDIMGADGFDSSYIGSKLSSQGVKVLCDNSFYFRGITFYGRNDIFSERNGSKRAFTKEICRNAEKNATVIIDHQPKDLKELGGLGADMTLSGHTHNGQIFPVSQLCSIIGINEMQYGKKQFGSNTAIVSSGIGTWGMNVRTSGKSEIVIIDVK